MIYLCQLSYSSIVSCVKRDGPRAKRTSPITVFTCWSIGKELRSCALEGDEELFREELDQYVETNSEGIRYRTNFACSVASVE